MAIPVLAEPNGITLNPVPSALEINVPTTFTATVNPSNATEKTIKWSVLDMSKAPAPGAATITPTSGDSGTTFTLKALQAGSFYLRATITNGKLT